MSECNDKLAPSEGFLVGHIQRLEGILSTGVEPISMQDPLIEISLEEGMKIIAPSDIWRINRQLAVATAHTFIVTEAARVGDEASMQ